MKFANMQRLHDKNALLYWTLVRIDSNHYAFGTKYKSKHYTPLFSCDLSGAYSSSICIEFQIAKTVYIVSQEIEIFGKKTDMKKTYYRLSLAKSKAKRGKVKQSDWKRINIQSLRKLLDEVER